MKGEHQERSFPLTGIEAALLRAAARARRLAAETGTPLVIVRDGRIVHEHPKPPEMPLRP